jgi:hypothetical protein
LLPILLNEFEYSIDFASPKTATSLKDNRVEPELSHTVITLDLNVNRFAAVSRIVEEPVGTNA